MWRLTGICAGEVHPEEEPGEAKRRSSSPWATQPGLPRPEARRLGSREVESDPHRIDTIRGPGRLSSQIFHRSSAGRRGKRC